MQDQLSQQSCDHNDQLNAFKEQVISLKAQMKIDQQKQDKMIKDKDGEIDKLFREIKEKQKIISKHENNISYLDVSICDMNEAKSDLEKENLKLKEEVKACKDLLNQKHSETAGQEQE